MRLVHPLRFAFVVALTGLILPAAARSAEATPITHIVIVVQENRTFDNLFNGYPGANSRRYGFDSKGAKIVLHPAGLATKYDLDHSHAGFETEWADGKLDGFDLEKSSGMSFADNAYGYVPYDEVKPYWDLAAEFTLSDEFFQTNEGPSFPAHQFLIAGQSGHFSKTNPQPLDGRDLGPLAMAENIGDLAVSSQAGCDSAAAGAKVRTIDQSLVDDPQPSTETGSPLVSPCVNYATILDELDAKGLTWNYYVPTYGVLWDAPDAISHIRYKPALWKNVVVPETSVFADIALGKLAAVSYVIPRATLSDHADITTNGGPDWVASVVNAVGESAYWKNTIVVVTWDDWGGWYDHVAPPIRTAYSDGFRVPALVISPYAKKSYVSHTERDFGAILHLIETNFGLPSLGESDRYNDSFADCFDFGKPARPYVPIAANGMTPALLLRLPPETTPIDSD
jgi:phospholipase C